METIRLDGRVRVSLADARSLIVRALPIEGGADVYMRLLPDGTPDWDGPIEVKPNPQGRRGELFIEGDLPALLDELKIEPRMILRPIWKDFGPGKALDEYSITRDEFSRLAECYGLTVEFDSVPPTSVAEASTVATPENNMAAAASWKMRVQAEATAMFLRLRKAGANPTVHSTVDALVKWCAANDVRTITGIVPSARYLREHVLSGKHWQPPQ